MIEEKEFAIVLAMARSGLVHEFPSGAYLHQVKRLANELSGKQHTAIQELLDWHNAGRKPGMVAIAPSSPLIPQKGGEQTDEAYIDRAWNKFNAALSDGPDSPYPGMAQAFENYYSQKWADPDWRKEASVWAAAWKQAGSAVLPQVGEAKPLKDPKMLAYLQSKGETWIAAYVATLECELEKLSTPASLGEAKAVAHGNSEPMVPEKLIFNPYPSNSEINTQAKHYNEGWNDCVDEFHAFCRAANTVVLPSKPTDEILSIMGLDERGYQGNDSKADLTNKYERLLVHLAAPVAQALPVAAEKNLTDADIERGWKATFSTDNPYCPCNLKSFTKAVRWAVRAMQGEKA